MTARQPTDHGMPRREAVKALGLGALSVGTAYGMAPPWFERFRRALARDQYEYRFFRPPEVATMRVLADMIIPRDERSGSATDAGAVEYIDFALSEAETESQQMWRDGLRWLDTECWQRHGLAFVECTALERGSILDRIAWPDSASADYTQAVQWFNGVRDLVGAGFFSSQMGVQDLGYRGGVFNPEWQGAPPEAVAELDVSYEEWDRRYGRQG